MLHTVAAVSRGSSPVPAPGLLIAAASLVAELGLWSVQASIVVVRGYIVAPGIWNLLGPEIKPVSLAWVGRFFTIEPPGKFPIPLLENDIKNIHVGGKYAQLTIHGNIYMYSRLTLNTFSSR